LNCSSVWILDGARNLTT